MSEELRECPFCGSGAIEVCEWEEYTLIGCLDCDYAIKCRDCDEEGAVNYWNTRPAEDALKAEIARYRRALYNLKEDCTRRKHFAVSDEEKLFLTEEILHIEAELDYAPATAEKGGR